MSTTERKVVTVCGDELEVYWNGSVWVSPSDGQQHARDTQAMRVELEAYFAASGEDVESDEITDEIDSILAQMI